MAPVCSRCGLAGHKAAFCEMEPFETSGSDKHYPPEKSAGGRGPGMAAGRPGNDLTNIRPVSGAPAGLMPALSVPLDGASRPIPMALPLTLGNVAKPDAAPVRHYVEVDLDDIGALDPTTGPATAPAPAPGLAVPLAPMASLPVAQEPPRPPPSPAPLPPAPPLVPILSTVIAADAEAVRVELAAARAQLHAATVTRQNDLAAHAATVATLRDRAEAAEAVITRLRVEAAAEAAEGRYAVARAADAAAVAVRAAEATAAAHKLEADRAHAAAQAARAAAGEALTQVATANAGARAAEAAGRDAATAAAREIESSAYDAAVARASAEDARSRAEASEATIAALTSQLSGERAARLRAEAAERWMAAAATAAARVASDRDIHYAGAAAARELAAAAATRVSAAAAAKPSAVAEPAFCVDPPPPVASVDRDETQRVVAEALGHGQIVTEDAGAERSAAELQLEAVAGAATAAATAAASPALRALGLAFRVYISAPHPSRGGHSAEGGLAAARARALSTGALARCFRSFYEGESWGETATETEVVSLVAMSQALAVVAGGDEPHLDCPYMKAELAAAVASGTAIHLLWRKDDAGITPRFESLPVESSAALKAAWPHRIPWRNGEDDDVEAVLRARLGLTDALLERLPLEALCCLSRGANGGQLPSLVTLETPKLPRLQLDGPVCEGSPLLEALVLALRAGNTTLQRLAVPSADVASAAALATAAMAGASELKHLRVSPSPCEIPVAALRRHALPVWELDGSTLRPQDAAAIAAILCAGGAPTELHITAPCTLRRISAELLAAASRPALAVGLHKFCAIPIKAEDLKGALDLTAGRLGLVGSLILSDAITRAGRSPVVLLLGGNEFGAVGITAVMDSLVATAAATRLLSLDRLSLADNRLGPEGLAAMLGALDEPDGGCTLSVGRLDLAVNAIGAEGARHLARLLLASTVRVTELGLASNALDSDAAKALAGCLAAPGGCELIHLRLQGNNVGDKGAASLGLALSSNTCLLSLNLAENYSIGGDGTRSIAAALMSNFTLKELDLSKNQLGPDGAKALGAALKTNSGLTGLLLNRCGLREDGARHLAEAIAVNKSLLILDLGRNVIGDRGALALARGLESNSTLKQLGLQHNGVRSVGCQAMKATRTCSVDLIGNDGTK